MRSAKMQNHSDRFRVGFLTGLVLPSLILFSLALGLFVVEVKLDWVIPHRTLTTTALWLVVGFAAILVFSRSLNAENIPGMKKENVSTLRKATITLLSITMVFGALARFGVDLTAYLVGLGVGAIVVGFAAQSTISNFISGILVYIEKTIRTGDYVRVNVPAAPVEGTIEEISFLRTRVATNDGIKVSIPNTLMLTTTVSNYSFSEERPLVVSLNLSTSSLELSKLKDELVQAMNVHFGADEVSRAYLRSMERDRVNVELWIKIRTAKFLTERDRVVQGVSTICKRLNLKLNSLTTT
jgi:small conductance mechanosensitive channel